LPKRCSKKLPHEQAQLLQTSLIFTMVKTGLAETNGCGSAPGL
jgi:hypothetical protein